MNSLSLFQHTFDKNLISYLQDKQSALSSINKQGSILIEILTEFIQYGGKRIRPALYYTASTSYGIPKREALEQAIVFELFQTFCLIHDDIIDQSPLRRGKPTMHTKYTIPTALLAGNMALMLADEVYYQAHHSSAEIVVYNRFKQEVLVGEYLDSIGYADAQLVMELKTARYTFMRPVELGLIGAQVDSKTINIWNKIMCQIGIAFQLKDDLMGVFGNESSMGKSINSDLQERKHTRLIELFNQHAPATKKKQFSVLFSKKNLNETECDTLRDLLQQQQVVMRIQKEITQTIHSVEKYLETIPEVQLHVLTQEIINHITDMKHL